MSEAAWVKKEISHEIIINKIKEIWPDFILQNSEFEDSNTEEEILFQKPSEFFVYKNKYYFHEWDKYGCIEENYNTMIHILINENHTKLISDDIDNNDINKIIINVLGEGYMS